MDDLIPWLIVLAAAVITYGMRALGVVAAGRFAADSALVRWIGCVSYAMLAALFSRMILMPAGQLAQVPLVYRAGALAIAVLAWWLAGRNVFVGTCAGLGAVIAFTYWG